MPAEIWNFYIGGYQVCEKWLKDRKGRKLTYEDTRHYQRIVVALNETIRDMTEIDEVIRQQGDWPSQTRFPGTTHRNGGQSHAPERICRPLGADDMTTSPALRKADAIPLFFT